MESQNIPKKLLEIKPKLNVDNTWTIYSYEGNRDVYLSSITVREEIKNKFRALHHFNQAVTDYDGIITFNKHKGAWNLTRTEYIKNYDTGANCLDINPKFDSGNGVIFDIVQEEVECVDINNVIQAIVTNDPLAQIYIKCDIEGSEYKVLPRILESNYVNNIKELYVEWHERFWSTDATQYQEKCSEKQNIINRFKLINIPCHVWY